MSGRPRAVILLMEKTMREALLILFAACIAALPFIAFNEWFHTAPSHQEALTLWSDDLRQSNQTYTMPKASPVSIVVERR